MYARAVRFTGVNQETVDRVRQRVEESDGPPPGVKSTAMKLLYDADRVFEEMDPGDTPGTRASVDRCEVVIEREA
jgi:hypothetical protein